MYSGTVRRVARHFACLNMLVVLTIDLCNIAYSLCIYIYTHIHMYTWIHCVYIYIYNVERERDYSVCFYMSAGVGMERGGTQRGAFGGVESECCTAHRRAAGVTH